MSHSKMICVKASGLLYTSNDLGHISLSESDLINLQTVSDYTKSYRVLIFDPQFSNTSTLNEFLNQLVDAGFAELLTCIMIDTHEDPLSDITMGENYYRVEKKTLSTIQLINQLVEN